MKILRISNRLYPYKVGGMGVHAHEMSKWQANRGHNVVVYTVKVGNYPMQERKDGYEIVRFKPFINIFGNPFTVRMLFDLIRFKSNFDIIHAHSYFFLSTNLTALSRRFGSQPLVISIHNLNTHTAPSWFENIYVPTLGKWTLNSADKIICYTNVEKRRLEKLGITPSKITVIHNGIAANKFVPKEKENSDEIRILWIGRVLPAKGVEYLIDAVKLLVPKIQNLKLIMIGEGPSKEKIKRKISDLGLDKHIIFKDFVLNSELPSIYQSSDVFVLPSINEGIPRTILEAMACGLPVVCTKLPQLTDVVEGCGILVPVGDSQAFADAISKIISDRELAQKFAEGGRANVVKNYSWEDTMKKTIRLYEELICQK